MPLAWKFLQSALLRGGYPLGRFNVGVEGRKKPSNLVELTLASCCILFRNAKKYRGLRRYRGLWNLHGQCGWKPFRIR
jgi:hypothetical protein